MRTTEEKKEYQAAWYAANRERLRARNAEYRAKNSEKRRAYNAAYDAANVEKRRARQAVYRAEHRSGKYPVEAKVEQYLVDCVKARGGMCPKFNDPGRRGAPDRIVCLPGHAAYFVELKRPKVGKLDAHQVRYHDALRAAGQRVWVIWSHEEVDGFFAEI